MNNKSVFSNFIWRFAERCGAQIVQFIVSIVLARLLLPETFGTVALVIVIAQIFQVFVDSGLGNELFSKRNEKAKTHCKTPGKKLAIKKSPQ